MPRWVWITGVSVLLFCGSCVSFGYFVIGPFVRNTLSNGQDNVSDQMAETISTSVAATITSPVYWPHRITIPEQKLDVNNATAGGEVGIETGTDGTYIYGFVTEIGPEGISLLGGEAVTYSGIPVIQNGLLELTDVRVSAPLLDLFLTSAGFEQAMEDGFNRALQGNGMAPVSLSLGNGVLVIVVEPSPSGSAVG